MNELRQLLPLRSGRHNIRLIPVPALVPRAASGDRHSADALARPSGRARHDLARPWAFTKTPHVRFAPLLARFGKRDGWQDEDDWC